jgi:phosphatidylethanolamine-binding protein (PEBP) family uncharacterized protein
MLGERFLKPQTKESQSTEEERAIARTANEEADPTTYSPLPLPGNMPHTVDFDVRARPHTIGVHESGEYVELRKDPKVQMAVALLAKGIVPVADVVQLQDKPEKHYSKVMPLEKIEHTTTKDELLAQLEFMYLALGDYDHRTLNSVQHNYVHKDGKAVLYDFGDVDLNMEFRGLYPPRQAEHTVESLVHLKELLAQFQARIEGEDGEKFIASVLEHARLQPSDLLGGEGTRSISDIQEVLLSRINRSLLIAENERRELLAGTEAK